MVLGSKLHEIYLYIFRLTNKCLVELILVLLHSKSVFCWVWGKHPTFKV